MLNKNKLRGKIAEKGLTIGRLADSIGINRSTFYRKLKKEGENFTIKEVILIGNTLEISEDELLDIFFDKFVA